MDVTTAQDMLQVRRIECTESRLVDNWGEKELRVFVRRSNAFMGYLVARGGDRKAGDALPGGEFMRQ
jgi:hypothetical protein